MTNAPQAATPNIAAMFINFSQLLKKRVRSADGRHIGSVWDISLKFGEVYPKSDTLIITTGFFKRLYASTPWKDISTIDDDIVVGRKVEDLEFSPACREYEFLLRRDILDQQVVDTYNHKVIRVNDVHLLRVDHELMIAHVDIGLRGLIRRLDWEEAVDFLVRLWDKNAHYLKREDLVSWKYVQPVSSNPASVIMKLSLSQKQLLSIPPADLNEIMMDLNLNQRMALFRTLDQKMRAKVFENMELDDQKTMLKELDKREAAEILEAMSADEATDLLEKLPRKVVDNILTLIESNRARKLSTLLGYSSDSAGGLMTTEFVSLPDTIRAGAAIDYIKTSTPEFELVPYIYIVDEKNHLKGITTVRRLLFACPNDSILATAFPKTLYVHLSDSVKEVAYFMDKYKFSTIPVVDENKVLHGIITMDDILSQLISIAWRKRPRPAKGA
jgi:CBS domain-containing protein/sporulation protein YlmC with PRC-barrel domain